MAEAATKPKAEAKPVRATRNPVPDAPAPAAEVVTEGQQPAPPKPLPVPQSLGLNRAAEPFKVRVSWFRDPEQLYRQYQVRVPFDTKFKDLLTPEAWALLADKFVGNRLTGQQEQIGSTILVQTEDLSWRAEFEVLYAGVERLEVVCIGPRYDEDGNGQPHYLQPDLPETDRYEIAWDGGDKGYNIIRRSDRAIVANAKDIRTKRQVTDWLERDGR